MKKKNKVTGWLKNAIQYLEANNVGNCPDCNSEKTSVEEHIFSTRKSWTFSCKNCGSWAHFDGGTNSTE